MDKAAEKLCDQLRPTEALNETVTQAAERAFESHLKGRTEKEKQSHGVTEADPEGPGSSAKGKWLGPSPY